MVFHRYPTGFQSVPRDAMIVGLCPIGGGHFDCKKVAVAEGRVNYRSPLKADK